MGVTPTTVPAAVVVHTQEELLCGFLAASTPQYSVTEVIPAEHRLLRMSVTYSLDFISLVDVYICVST